MTADLEDIQARIAAEDETTACVRCGELVACAATRDEICYPCLDSLAEEAERFGDPMEIDTAAEMAA